MDGQPKRIKAKAAAEMLGVTPRTVQNLAGKGELPGAAKIGKQWTFDPKKLVKFIADKEAEVAARADWRPPPALRGASTKLTSEQSKVRQGLPSNRQGQIGCGVRESHGNTQGRDAFSEATQEMSAAIAVKQ
nr:helix-turn-helix domain-containing protein [Rhodoblastus sphagnicola]